MYSKTILVGNLGNNPTLRQTSQSKPVCNFVVATNDHYNDNAQFHNIVTWGKTAEACKKYLSTGRKVTIEGRIQYQKWTNKEGKTQYSTEIHAEKIVFMGNNTQKENTNDSDDLMEQTDLLLLDTSP